MKQKLKYLLILAVFMLCMYKPFTSEAAMSDNYQWVYLKVDQNSNSWQTFSYDMTLKGIDVRYPVALMNGDSWNANFDDYVSIRVLSGTERCAYKVRITWKFKGYYLARGKYGGSIHGFEVRFTRKRNWDSNTAYGACVLVGYSNYTVVGKPGNGNVTVKVTNAYGYGATLTEPCNYVTGLASGSHTYGAWQGRSPIEVEVAL